jgi:hypothetical protein
MSTINLNFRPRSYADFDDPSSAALTGIKGRKRREMVRDMLSAEGDKRAAYDAALGPIEEEILRESVADPSGSLAHRVLGPEWLGGEYLPNLDRSEVEIARIELRSTLADVFSLRARVEGGRYVYRMTDEYESTFELTPATSEATLTLQELVRLIDGVKSPTLDLSGRPFVEAWWWSLHGCSYYTLEDCTDFAWVASEQYPQLGAYYEERAREWREERARAAAGTGGGET